MEIRAIVDDEWGAFRHTVSSTFGMDPMDDPQGDERFRALIERGRAFAAFDGAALVATAATFALELSIPGGSLPMAGLTMVTVRPSHRRRGILRGLIDAHLADARGRGEPLSGLWASETAIYPRFGYGLAAESDDLAFAAAGLSFAADTVGDQVDLLEGDAAAQQLPELHARALGRPGMLARSADWWKYRRLVDRPDLRKGATPRRHVAARRGGALTGYAAYRQRPSWAAGLPTGAVEVDELVATDGRAEASLWHYLANVDLFPNVSWWNAPVDCVLPWVVNDPRRIRRRRTDALWLRIEDFAAALSARRYGGDGALVLAVSAPDGRGEATTWSLRVTGGEGRCEPGRGPADLRLES